MINLTRFYVWKEQVTSLDKISRLVDRILIDLQWNLYFTSTCHLWPEFTTPIEPFTLKLTCMLRPPIICVQNHWKQRVVVKTQVPLYIKCFRKIYCIGVECLKMLSLVPLWIAQRLVSQRWDDIAQKKILNSGGSRVSPGEVDVPQNFLLAWQISAKKRMKTDICSQTGGGVCGTAPGLNPPMLNLTCNEDNVIWCHCTTLSVPAVGSDDTAGDPRSRAAVAACRSHCLLSSLVCSPVNPPLPCSLRDPQWTAQ